MENGGDGMSVKSEELKKRYMDGKIMRQYVHLLLLPLLK